MESIQQGRLQQFEEVLLKLDPNATDDDGCSLLHWAAINNRVAMTSHLLGLGASVNVRGGLLGETPLMWASRYDYPRMLSVLLCSGADAGILAGGYDALHLACQAGNVNSVFLLLTLGKANPSQVIDGEGNSTLLHLLKNRPPASRGHNHHHHHHQNSPSHTLLNVVRLLLNFGADVLKQDGNGNNALHILAGAPFKYKQGGGEDGAALYASTPAVNDRDMKLAWLVITAAGDKWAQLTAAKNSQGKTPFQVATEKNNFLISRLLGDFWMLKTLPWSLPVIVTVLTVVSFFLWLWALGWLGTLAFSLSLVVFDRTAQASIRMYEGRLSLGLNIGLILSIGGCYIFFLQSYYSSLTNFVFVLEVMGILFALHKTSMTDVASLPKTAADDDSSLGFIIDRIIAEGPQEGPAAAQQKSGFQLCPTCITDRLSASVHCSACDKCVVCLDHHCPFVNSCVAKSNRRSFVAFCLLASLGSAWVAAASLHVQYSSLCASVPYSNVFHRAFLVKSCVCGAIPPLAVATWAAILVAFWTGAMGVAQLAYVAIETSGYELMNQRHDGSCRGVGFGRAMRNLWVFAVTGNYSITPQSTSKGGAGCSHDHAHGRDETEPFLQLATSPAKKRANSASGGGSISATTHRHGQHVETV